MTRELLERIRDELDLTTDDSRCPNQFVVHQDWDQWDAKRRREHLLYWIIAAETRKNGNKRNPIWRSYKDQFGITE